MWALSSGGAPPGFRRTIHGMTERPRAIVSSRLSPVMVGRDGFLEQSGRLLGAILAGDGRFLLLAGEAGIGKTRLVDAIERKPPRWGSERSVARHSSKTWTCPGRHSST